MRTTVMGRRIERFNLVLSFDDAHEVRRRSRYFNVTKSEASQIIKRNKHVLSASLVLSKAAQPPKGIRVI